MKRSVVLRVFAIVTCLSLFLGIPADQGSPIVSSHPSSPHHRVGIYLTSYALTKPGFLDQVLREVRAGKLDTLVINVKNMHGEVTYESAVPLANKIGASTGRLDLRTLLPSLREHGIYLVARQVLFYDPKLASYLGKEGAWAPPDDDRVIAYNLEIAQEVASLGFDEIQFDYVRFADEGELVPAYEDHYSAVNRFLAEAERRLSGRVVLSVDLFGRVLWNWNKKRIDPIGQSLEEIAPHVDLLSPMLYPSHYSEQRYKDDPYLVVTEALTTGQERVTTPFRPFLQAFDREIPRGMSLEDYIRARSAPQKSATPTGTSSGIPLATMPPFIRLLNSR